MVTTLIDTSAWIEYLRDTHSPTADKVRSLIADEAPIAGTDVVYMELLAGTRSAEQAKQLRRLLNRMRHFPVRPHFDYNAAAAIYRTCRRNGTTPRAMNDCLVAAVAIDRGAAVLHHDRDFTAIAEHTGLLLAD